MTTLDRTTFSTVFDGQTAISVDKYRVKPKKTGWAKLSYKIKSGSGTISVKENDIALDQWSAITASNEELIWVTKGFDIIIDVTASSSLKAKILFDCF